jgi:hypothetical protein
MKYKYISKFGNFFLIVFRGVLIVLIVLIITLFVIKEIITDTDNQ